MARETVWVLSFIWMFNCSALWAQHASIESVLPLKIYGQHLIVVQGSIGSLGKRNLVIDTGAYPSIIDRSIAKKMKLTGTAENVDAVHQTLSRVAVVVPSIDVGPIHSTNVRTLVDDLSSISQELGVRIDALIGMDVLADSSFRIDYVSRRIFFGRVLPLPSSAPFENVDSMICVALRAGQQSLRLLVDTGAEKTLLFGRHLPEIPGRSQPLREFRNLAGHFALRQINLQSLQLGDTELAAQPIFVSEAAKLPPYQFDGFLSTLQFQQIAFDFERQEFSWMTKDSRREDVRVAVNSSRNDADSMVSRSWMATPGAPPRICADRDGSSCGFR